MKIFISVANKLLFLILTILLIMVSTYSYFSLDRLKNDFKQHQVEALIHGQQQLNQHVGQFNTQLIAWLESFSDINQLQNKGDFKDFSQSLTRQYDRLQFYFNVEDIWLVQDDNVLFSTSVLNKTVFSNTNKVMTHHKPIEQIICDTRCFQILSIPLLNFNGDVAVITLTTSLVDILYSLNPLLDKDVAIVGMPKVINNDSQVNILSTSNNELTPLLKTQQTFDYSAEEAELLSLKDKRYLASFLYLAETDNNIYSLILIENVTTLLNTNNSSRIEFLSYMVFVFVIVAILIYLVIKPFTAKLLRLSRVLPMLSKKEFIQFRRVNLRSNGMLNDEFDVLADSTEALSLELEKLNGEVEQKTNELERIAMYDSLTGLPNRHMLNHYLNNKDSVSPTAKEKVAVLFLDLDDFKKVNDSHGHDQGDKLLIEASTRLKMNVRSVDVVYRFGGDEFVIILHQVDNINDVEKIANKILETFSEPIQIESSLFYVSTSIGIVFSEEEWINANSLISFADIAMYEAKDNGGSQYHIYHDDMFQRLSHRVFMENEVRQALLKQQFSLSLQPQIRSKDYKLDGFEALLRWNHPERGFISPDDFIPILENSAQMIELGYWVMRRCFELTTKFKKLEYQDIRIAINLSAGQFADPNLKTHLIRLLNEFDVEAQRFELELTEQTLVKDMNHTIAVMNELKEIGFSFAIDDFGTGYSSLSYLRKMPVDVIKIDKSFVFGMLENKADHQIILSTIAMVKSLELNVVAEGVETSAQLHSLTENSCDIIQGYYFSKPIPEFELFEVLEAKVNNGFWVTQG